MEAQNLLHSEVNSYTLPGNQSGSTDNNSTDKNEQSVVNDEMSTEEALKKLRQKQTYDEDEDDFDNEMNIDAEDKVGVEQKQQSPDYPSLENNAEIKYNPHLSDDKQNFMISSNEESRGADASSEVKQMVNESNQNEGFVSEEENYFDVEAYQKAREKYVYFWRNNDIYSQWNTRHHFFVNGQKFNCAEQFMMFKKAELFEDDEIAREILHCKDPRKIKALGRKVSGFKQEVWERECIHIVKQGNRAKFTNKNNDDYLGELLLTYPKILVEASPYDSIWGIGLEEDDPNAWNEFKWKGTNYLGFIITEVRDDIMVELGMIKEEDRQRYVGNLLSDCEDSIKSYDFPENHSFNNEEILVFSGDIFSQWHKSEFVVDEQSYCCAEQYMMHRKALLFDDLETAEQIINTDNPRKMKALGRTVKGFDGKKWHQHCLQIVKDGNKAKFSQNKDLLNTIVSTYPKIFAEANERDKFWGIGMRKSHPDVQRRERWRGQNLLGYILTEVRDELLVEKGLLEKEKAVKYMDKLLEDIGTSVDTDDENKKDVKESVTLDKKTNKHEEKYRDSRTNAPEERIESKPDHDPTDTHKKKKHKKKQKNVKQKKEEKDAAALSKQMDEEYHAEQKQLKEQSRKTVMSDNVEIAGGQINAIENAALSSADDSLASPDNHDSKKNNKKESKNKEGKKKVNDLNDGKMAVDQIRNDKTPPKDETNVEHGGPKKKKNKSSDKNRRYSNDTAQEDDTPNENNSKNETENEGSKTSEIESLEAKSQTLVEENVISDISNAAAENVPQNMSRRQRRNKKKKS